MDGSRFDGITRALAIGATRRRTIRGVAGVAVAGLLAHLGREEAAAACVKPGEKGCKGRRNRKCCDGSRCQGGSNRKEGRCVGPLGCRAGQQYCSSNSVSCPSSGDPNCFCATDVQGTLRCVDPISSTCSTCTTNAACGTGRVCIPSNNAGPCDCDVNACAVTCVS